MSDQKLTALTAFTPVLTDIVYAVDDPGGAPVSGKNTYAAIRDLLQANLSSVTITGGTIGGITALSATSSDAGASSGPDLILDRNSASPAASDLIGGHRLKGRDSAGNVTEYAGVFGRIVDPTDASEDGELELWSSLAGAFQQRVIVGGGLYLRGVTGGDQGTGSINTQTLYFNGTQFHYEEGTFTPTVIGTSTTGTATYSIQTGRYTRWGNRVEIEIRVAYSGHTGSGNMRLSGLPFAPAQESHALSLWLNNITVTAGEIGAYALASTGNVINLYEVATGGGALAEIALDTAGDIIITGSYEV